MSDIYAGIDLGSDSVKIIVCEKIDQKYHVLACTSKPSSGIKNGFISDMKSAVSSCKSAIKEASEMLGMKITKVIACVPPENCTMDIVIGEADVEDSENITGADVSNVIASALKNVDFDSEELVTAMPINFNIDDESSVSDPKGMKGKHMNARVVVSTTPKEPLYKMLEVLKLAGLETIDICYSSYGDYYSIKDSKYDELVGAVINIGEESTNISIFNRGIQIKNGFIPMGSKNVDKDLTYVYKCKLSDSRIMKEKFAVAVASYADVSEEWTLKVDSEASKEVNQLSVSKVVEARVRELLEVAKNEIKNLTNREIRYIIITGGLSEMAGFQYLVEQEFGFIAKICNLNEMGIRHNRFSSCYGVIQYFHDKLDLRGKTYNMFSDEDVEKIQKVDASEITDIINNKVLGHFFGD
ncbi:MAG: cell division protein FtsA [Bacilli bacterium]|nr:cell division protein FtsA [Bacilli bacterium]MBR6137218.1 cell division protein FtsA [Bacilli bacterium]